MWPFKKKIEEPEETPPDWLYDLIEALPLERWTLESGTMTCDAEIDEGKTVRVICQDRGEGEIKIGVSLVRKVDEKTVAATTRRFGPGREIRQLYDATLEAHIEALEATLEAAARRVIAKYATEENETIDETNSAEDETEGAEDETGKVW
jgi:hypothetical protein